MFLKKDGTERRMNCATNMQLIPEKFQIKTINEDGTEIPKRKKSDSAIPVFDTDKGEWRSFVKDNLKEINGQSIEEFEKN